MFYHKKSVFDLFHSARIADIDLLNLSVLRSLTSFSVDLSPVFSLFPKEYFYLFGSVVGLFGKHDLFASNVSRMFTAFLLISMDVLTPLCHFCCGAGFDVIPVKRFSSSSSLRPCSAPSGGGVPSDAAGRGQPLVSVSGGDLQAALRQEGHRARQPHLEILRSSGYRASSRHAGQPPGMETIGSCFQNPI